MSVLPPSAVASVAQTQLAQTQRSAEVDAPREAGARRAEKQKRRRAGQHEFVEDMAAATGLKVDPDGQDGSGGAAKHNAKAAAKHDGKDTNPASSPTDAQPADNAPADADSHDARSRSAALLADPGAADKSAPPPYMLDIEA